MMLSWSEAEVVFPEIAAEWDCLGPPDGDYSLETVPIDRHDHSFDSGSLLMARSRACRYGIHEEPCRCYLFNRRDVCPLRWMSRHAIGNRQREVSTDIDTVNACDGRSTQNSTSMWK